MPRKRHSQCEIGSLRRCTKILFRPMRIGNETRWFEKSTWLEKWNGKTWSKVKWIDKKGWGR